MVVDVDALGDVVSTAGVEVHEVTAMKLVAVGIVDVVVAEDGTDAVASGRGANDDDSSWRVLVVVLTVVLGVGEVVSSTSISVTPVKLSPLLVVVLVVDIVDDIVTLGLDGGIVGGW